MATYLQIRDLEGDQPLRNRAETAIWVVINTIGTEAAATADHAARIAWARTAIENTEQAARLALRIVLAANAGLTVAQMQAVTDAQLQTAVNSSIKVLAGIAT